MPTFELRPFAIAEAEQIAGWVVTPEDCWHLAATDEFPLTADDVAAWTFEADFAFTLRRDGDLVAYGEIVEDEVEQDVEIQHLLVTPDLRSQGMGRALLSRLCAFLAEARPYPEVWLRTSHQNIPAMVCAQAVGFQPISAISGPRYLWFKKALTP